MRRSNPGFTDLEEQVQETLRMAAVLGREFEFDILLQALELDEDDLVEAIESAEGAQMIEELGGRRVGLLFLLCMPWCRNPSVHWYPFPSPAKIAQSCSLPHMKSYSQKIMKRWPTITGKAAEMKKRSNSIPWPPSARSITIANEDAEYLAAARFGSGQ